MAKHFDARRLATRFRNVLLATGTTFAEDWAASIYQSASICRLARPVAFETKGLMHIALIIPLIGADSLLFATGAARRSSPFPLAL
jgi:hypothetical protein